MQKIKSIVRKIGAISTGVAFLGASLVGAMAADLSTYPDPFIVSGSANNAVIIHSASGLDSAAAGYVLTGFAGALTTTSAGVVTSVEGGYKLEKSGNKFNLNNTAYNIDARLTKTQLPVLLKKGTFVDDMGDNEDTIEYTQELRFDAKGKTIKYVYDQNREASDRPMGDYLYFDKGSNVNAWTYEFNLDSVITVANSADLQGTTLNLLGRDFTISSVSGFTAGIGITKLVLLAGDISEVVPVGDTVNGVTLQSVASDESSCTIEYQGKIITIRDGSTKTLADGTIVGVTQITASNKEATPDYCRLNIGADKVEFEDGKRVKVNGDYVEGSEVDFGINAVGFDVFNITYRPDSRIYLSPGEEHEDPIFGAFKLIFGGIVESSVEDINIEASGDEVKITATNMDGDTTTWVAFYANTSGTDFIRAAGGEDSPMIYIEGDRVTNASLGLDVENLADMESYDIRFLYSKDKRSHILKITDIDTRLNETDFMDETTGAVYVDQAFVHDGGNSVFNNVMPQSFTLNFSLDKGVGSTAEITFVDINDNGPIFYTQNEGNLTFNMLWNKSRDDLQLYRQDVGGPLATYALEFTEIDTSVESGTALRHLMINFTYDATDREIDISAVLSEEFVHGTGSLKQKNSDENTIKAGKTMYGTYIEQLIPSTSGADTILIQYPESATYAEVWISPVGATVSTTTEAETGIDIMSEGEISDVSMYNAIVVGGPAANEIAANLLGLTFPAIGEASGLVAGEAVLKMVENGANVALIAMGWDKEGTARAAKVLQSYGEYDLSGTEASIEGTTASPTVVTSE